MLRRLLVILVPFVVAEIAALFGNVLAALIVSPDRAPISLVVFAGVLQTGFLIPLAALAYVVGSRLWLLAGRIVVAILAILAVPITLAFDAIHGATSGTCRSTGLDCALDPVGLLVTLVVALVPAIVLGIPLSIAARRLPDESA
jgi:hypothetical protein